MTVIKRDGTVVEFDRNKIIVALQKANEAVDEENRITDNQIEAIADYIADKKRITYIRKLSSLVIQVFLLLF